MAGTRSNWEDELRTWLDPFLDRLGHKARRRMCPLYMAGLIGRSANGGAARTPMGRFGVAAAFAT